MSTVSTLREHLEEITGKFIEFDVERQIPAIEALRGEFSHSIQLARAALVDDPRTFDFNCHSFTFGLDENDEFWRLRAARPDMCPDGRFVSERLLPMLSPAGDAPRYWRCGHILGWGAHHALGAGRG